MSEEMPYPEILRGVRGHCEVRFHYETADSENAYVSGHLEAVGPTRENITAIKVRLGAASAVPGKHSGDTCQFAIDRIKADPETGLIIPVSQAERRSGTGAARYLGPSDAQVRYALSLCNREGDPGGRNFRHYTEAGFRAMSRPEISRWIDTAKFELGEN